MSARTILKRITLFALGAAIALAVVPRALRFWAWIFR